MEEVLKAFGVDWRLLIIQAVNFGLLLLVLWQFLYKPLMKMLDARRTTIEEGVENAHKAQATLHKIEEEKGSILAAATKEGESLLERAQKAGSDRERTIVAQAEMKASALVKAAEAEAAEAKKRALSESKAEIAKLIVLGAEKVIRENA